MCTETLQVQVKSFFRSMQCLVEMRVRTVASYDSGVRCLLLQQLTQEQLWANRHTWRHQWLRP